MARINHYPFLQKYKDTTEQDEKWTTGKKYFDMEEYFTWLESEILGQTYKLPRIFQTEMYVTMGNFTQIWT